MFGMKKLAARGPRITLFTTILLFIAAALPAHPVFADESATSQRWVGTWTASPNLSLAPLNIEGQTLRQIVHTSIGGDTVRVRLSNAFGTTPLRIGAAHLAVRSTGASIVPGSDRVLTFSGSPTVTIPPGALLVSDPVKLQVPRLGDLAVSIYLPDAIGPATEHLFAMQTTYISSQGDFTGAASITPVATKQSWYFLSGVEVNVSPRKRSIVVFGDSITDGAASTVDANRRWTDFLAARLQALDECKKLAVLNQGISGNQLLNNSGLGGQNALARFDRDVLVQSGAKYVLVLEGINDIGLPGAFGFPNLAATAEQLIAAHRQLIERAHTLGLKIYGGTLTPFEGTTTPGYFSTAGEAKRQTLNAWIRTSGAYDGVIDFDAALRDPAQPTRLRSAYDSGDHLHPNDDGYRAMANAVNLSLFCGDSDD